jgi:hypothetical protein
MAGWGSVVEIRRYFPVLVIVFLCGNSYKPDQVEKILESKHMNATELIELSARFTIEAQELVLSYEVSNRSQQDIYLINRLYRSSPVWELNANIIYVYLDTRTRAVWLNKKIPDIPKGVLVNSPVAPFITPVRAGTNFREDVRIPLPLQDYRQYGYHAGGPSTVARKTKPEANIYKQVYFTLGYYWRMEGADEEIRNIHDTNVVFPIVTPQSGFPEFSELQTEVQQLDIPVLQYMEP